MNSKSFSYENHFYPNISEAYKDKFIKIPCEYFEYLQYDDKLLLTLSSLFKRKTLYNVVVITLKDIITENGYVPAKGKNRNIEQFKLSLFNLMQLHIIEFYSNELQQVVERQDALNRERQEEYKELPEYTKLLESITLNTKLALKFNDEKFNEMTRSNFTMLDFNAINVFYNICEKNKKVKITNLINVYIIIKKYIDSNKNISDNEWNVSISLLCKKLKISRKTVCDIIKVLKENKVLAVNKKEHKNYFSLENI